MRIQLRLLGRFAAGVESVPPRPLAISARRRRAVLAYLAMQPAWTESRERLADLLWGDSLDKQARQSLRQCLVSLRKELDADAPDLLVVERDVVGLNPDLVQVDARTFAELADTRDIAGLERAATLWQGPFLDGLDIEAEPFNVWLTAERMRLAALAARTFEACATGHDQAGRGAEAIAAAERLVALDSLHEPAHRLLLQITARHRGRDAALARGNLVVENLRRELDAPPEPETVALLAEIRRGAITPARSVPSRPTPSGADGVAPAAEAAPRTATLQPQPGLLEAAAPGGMARLETPTEPRQPLPPPAKVATRGYLHPALWSAAGVAVCGTLALALVGSSWFTAPKVPTAQASSAATRSEDQSWRSPGILPGAGPALNASGISAVIVLPFTAESNQPGREKTLAGRITDDLINDLSRVPGLRVISRATSRLYQDRAIDVAAVGQELGVRYVVEGNIRLQDSLLRVNAALTDSRSRLQVWSERFERDRDQRFAMQDEMVRGIARQLHVTVLFEEDRRRPPAGDPGIDDLLAKGWAAMLRISTAGTTSGADGYFERVLKRDPENMSALVGLGAYHATVVAMFLVNDPEPHLVRAEELLGRAVRKNPRHSLAHYFQGVLHKTRAQPHAALASFAKTLEINPSYAPAHAQVGHVLSRTGRLQDALEHVRYAIRLSPKDPNLGLWSVFGGQILLELGDDRAAIEWLSRAVALDPTSPFNHVTLAAAYMLNGDSASAARHVAEVRRLAPWLTPKIMTDRLVGTSDTASQPKRLLQGLHLAFPSPA